MKRATRRRRVHLSIDRLERRDVPASFGNAWPLPMAMSISFVPDGTRIGPYVSDLQAVAPAAWGPEWQLDVLAALQTWAAQTGMNFAIKADGGEPLGSPGSATYSPRFGDIRVAAHPMPLDVIAFSIPYDGSAGTWAGDLILNSAYAGPSPGVQAVDLYSVVLHEAGNLLGLPDSEDPQSPLFDYYRGRNSELQPDDVRGLRELYGARPADRYEGAAGNGSLETATSIVVGPWGPAEAVLADLGNGDVDVYRVTAPAGADRLQFRVVNSSFSLLTSRIIVYDADGRVVGSAVAGGPQDGQVEMAVDRPLAGRDYFVEVRGARGDVFDVGSYALVVDAADGAADALDRLRLETMGPMYFFSNFEAGMPGTPDDWATSLDILYRTPPRGRPAAYTAAMGRVLDDFLASLDGMPFDLDAFVQVGVMVANAGPVTLLEPGMMPALLSGLQDRGALDGLIRDLWGRSDLRGLLQEVLGSGALDDAFVRLRDSGGLNALARELWGSPKVRGEFLALLDSGVLDPIIAPFLETASVREMVSRIFPGGTTPTDPVGLRKLTSDLLARFDEWGMEDDWLRMFLEGFRTSGGASAAFQKLLGSGAMDELGQALLTSDVVGQMSEALLSSAARRDPSLMAGFYKAFIPPPNTDYAKARGLASFSYSSEFNARHLIGLATTDDARPTTITKVEVPWYGGRVPGTMLVSAVELVSTPSRPVLHIYDADGRPVEFEVLDSGGGSHAVQVRNPVAGSTYFIETSQVGPPAGPVPATYLLDAYFGEGQVEMGAIASGAVAAGGAVQAVYVAPETQIVHWLLSVQGSGSIRLRVLDASGAVVHTATCQAGEDVGFVIHLPLGAYSLILDGRPDQGGPSPGLKYQLRGQALSDSINPYVQDSSLRPVGAVTPRPSARMIAAGPGDRQPGASPGAGLAVAPLGPISAPHLNSFGAEGPAGTGFVSVARGIAGPPSTTADLIGDAAPRPDHDVAGRAKSVGFGPAAQARLELLGRRRPTPFLAASPPADDGLGAHGVGVASTGLEAAPRRPLWPVVLPTAGLEGETTSGTARGVVLNLPHDLAFEALDEPRSLAEVRAAEIVVVAAILAGAGKARIIARRRSPRPMPRGPTASFGRGGRPGGRGVRHFPRSVLIVRASSRTGGGLRLRRWLEADGVEVCEATGRDWEAGLEGGPDIILLEYGPGGPAGVDLLQRIGEIPGAAAVPVIIFSDADFGGIAAEAAAEGLDLGAADVLPLSITPGEFRARLRRAVRNRRQLESLEREASNDGLTGLCNRVAYESRLAATLADCWRSGRPLGLLVADLDHFKRVNDTCGHPTGDRVLRRVAAALAEEVGGVGFAARLGGEEFAVVVPGFDRGAILRIAERIRRRVCGLEVDDLRLPCPITISIGAAWTRAPDRSGPDELLARADRALYEAKAAGRDAVYMSDDALTL